MFRETTNGGAHVSTKKRMQHLTLFLLKPGVKKFEDAVKTDEAGNPKLLADQSFEGALYLPEPALNAPGWLPFVQAGFPKQYVDDNRMSSALVLLKVKKRMFAVTFGNARHLLKPDSFERDFGLRVVVNRVSKDNIRSISLRIFKETSVKRQEEAAKGTALRTFGVDIQQDLLRGVTGVPEDTSLASRLSGADSLAIDVAMEFGDLADKCKELLDAYNGTDYVKRGFDWIDNLKVVRSPAVVEQLDRRLLKALKAKDTSIQMLCPDIFSRGVIRAFLHHGEEDCAEKHTELDLAEWWAAIGGKLSKLTGDELRTRRISAFDSEGTLLAEIPDRECFVFETNVKGTKYVLSNGEWFELSQSFDDQITQYILDISNRSCTLPHFNKTWETLEQKESKFIEEASKLPDFMSLHTKNFTVNGTKVEPCDLLSRTGTLIHVKMWGKSSSFSHLLAQGAISAETLLRNSDFRAHVVSSATKHKTAIKRLFPKEGFVTSKIDVVLALVSRHERLPFFSRLNLMREAQRIERLGYRVRYQRIAIK